MLIVYPEVEVVKYLDLHLGRRLTWKPHIQAKRKQLNPETKQMYWMIGKRSKISLDNNLLQYKAIIKPIWRMGYSFGEPPAAQISK